MQGVQKFLQLLNDNWITILVCLGCVAGIVRKTVNFFSKSDDEKIKIAKSQIQETILKMISDAELNGKIGMLLVLLNVHRLSKRFIENILFFQRLRIRLLWQNGLIIKSKNLLKHWEKLLRQTQKILKLNKNCWLRVADNHSLFYKE